jgi:hypothetical protein
MPRNVATKDDRSPPPASQTRAKLAITRPVPIDEPIPDTIAAVDAARLADDYDAICVKLDEFTREKERIRVRLIEAMKAANKKNFNTMHGRVTLLDATESKPVADEKAAVALLESRGIPQPPTMEAWLAQHRIPMPTKDRPGLPDRIKFEMNE